MKKIVAFDTREYYKSFVHSWQTAAMIKTIQCRGSHYMLGPWHGVLCFNGEMNMAAIIL